ncbi:hypothetical protein GCM10020219_035610 [Nonomuraea dietziae]
MPSRIRTALTPSAAEDADAGIGGERPIAKSANSMSSRSRRAQEISLAFRNPDPRHTMTHVQEPELRGSRCPDRIPRRGGPNSGARAADSGARTVSPTFAVVELGSGRTIEQAGDMDSGDRTPGPRQCAGQRCGGAWPAHEQQAPPALGEQVGGGEVAARSFAPRIGRMLCGPGPMPTSTNSVPRMCSARASSAGNVAHGSGPRHALT